MRIAFLLAFVILLPFAVTAQTDVSGDWLVYYWDYEHLKIKRAKQDSVVKEIEKLPFDQRTNIYERLSQFDYTPKDQDYLDGLYDFFSLHIEAGNTYLQPFHAAKISLELAQTEEEIKLLGDEIEFRLVLMGDSKLELYSGIPGDNLKELRLTKLKRGNFDQAAWKMLKREIRAADWEIRYGGETPPDTLWQGDPVQLNLVHGHIILGLGKAGKLSSGTVVVNQIAEDRITGEISTPLGLVKLEKEFSGAEFVKCELRRIRD